jgi:hypothetical protein
MAAIPTARSPEAFEVLSTAAQGLKDGLAQSRALRALSRGAPGSKGPAAGLATLLKVRGHALTLAGEEAVDSPARRRALWALGLAAAEMAAPGAALELAAAQAEGALVLTAALPLQGARPEGASLALARGIVTRQGGGVVLEPDAPAGRMTLRATLPAPQAAAAPDARRA